MSLNGPINDSHPVSNSGGKSPGSILVVEDNPHVQRLMETILRFNEYRTFSASSSTEAILLCQTQSPDIQIAIVDYSMFATSQLDLLGKLRSLAPHLKIILTSGLPREDCHLSGHPLVYDIFLSKPFVAAELLSALKQLNLANHH